LEDVRSSDGHIGILATPDFKVNDGNRSFETINDEDLKKLASIAAEDRRHFLSRKPRYTGDFLCSALCQGAALYFVDGKNGVKDFDVWSFYAKEQGIPPFPPRRHVCVDFGESKFGKSAGESLKGRRVDVFGRSIKRNGNAIESVQRYLRDRPTRSAYFLEKKAAVLLEPANLRGTIIWPVKE
jgi:hypothetical protein